MAPDKLSLEEESAALDGYFSDTPLKPEPNYPPLRDTFETSVVIINLPKAPAAKLEKLYKVIHRLVTKIGNLATSDENEFTGLQIPIDPETNMTRGFAFVEFASAQDATQAVISLKDYPLDKNHMLQAVPYTQVIALKNLEEKEFIQPEPAPFEEKPDTSSWLLDPSQRDQFVIRQGKETVVYWSDARHDPTVDYDGSREKQAGIPWCDYYVQWSPHGSYLATMVPSKGVILWGGSTYEKLGRFPSQNVEVVLFSPQEKFLLTSNNNRDDPHAIKIFDIETGKKLRTFPLFPPDFFSSDLSKEEKMRMPPPPFQWSHDDKYLARMGKDLITIYDTATMKLLDRRSLTAPGIREFQFSPKANILAYWAPEQGNAPAHVDLIELPSRNKLRQKNLFNVSKCSMVWQNEGSFLGVKVTRHTKSKKTLYNNLELFRLEDPGVPVEMVEIKDAVMAFAWEPNGSRFAILHAENPTSTKVNVSFYDMNKVVGADQTTSALQIQGKKKSDSGGTSIVAEVNKVDTLVGKQCNCLFWSPAGQHIIFASLGDSASGTLEFYDVDSKTLTVKEHYRANQVMWDPSGRTVVTVVSQPIQGGHFKFAMDNGYILWNFQGKQLSQQSFETFYQFQWRPRQTLLSKDQISKVVKNLKKYEKEFDRADKALSRARYLEETRGKRLLRTEYRDIMGKLAEFRRQQKAERKRLLGGYDSDDESNYVNKEVIVETILSTKEEVV
jgi:translation initiation factor 3 subunit B